jgi:RND family efflux transporter MFP subunit
MIGNGGLAMRWVIVGLSVWVGANALAQEPESVTLVTFEQVALKQEREASATVESLDQAVIAAEISARVLDVAVRVGQTVSAGESLVELDPADYLLAVQAAEANLEAAEAGLEMATLRAERARRLAPDRFVSDDELLVAETQLRQARAERSAAEVELNRAELMRSRTTVTSPYDAVVQSRLIGAGALAAPGTPLLELVATDRLEVSSGIASRLIDGLLASDTIVFSDGQNEYPLRLASVSPLVSPGARQREARFEFIGLAPAPGSQGTIVWSDPRTMLPADFVMLRGGELGVLTVDGDRTVGSRADVRWLPLPQADAGRPVQVDLAPDQWLIDDGRRRVQPGQSVVISAQTP